MTLHNGWWRDFKAICKDEKWGKNMRESDGNEQTMVMRSDNLLWLQETKRN